mmetsp:Transcript_61072/g.149520  ORF Transcript_61072/g.149520 Transcript_61072/m.149520 type:complete len:231 (-) Transcript_61072:1166-1858(-)|eukprot:CAMPEP_0113452836 /NCGR_PEP_ID=MMETSP0014_2-20120614/7050_1 /TAXON_ID=2857 /ORGANISM="Nitzschia sp." /LENGTH=230 /DNA_ID=CAMNT_0000344217 /DNA_START=90 /DNA_END=782 /DNA_ORIENTATION=- /assembly_acc=CAM_ASM_000159
MPPVPGAAMTDAEKASVLKMQAFVRGALTRARVSLMVQKLIDELLAQRNGGNVPSANGPASHASTVPVSKPPPPAPVSSPPQSPAFAVQLKKPSARQSASALFSQSRSSQQSPQTGTESPYSPTRRKKNLDPKLARNATRHVTSSLEVLSQHGERMDAEISQLLKDIYRIGEPGSPTVTFGQLFDDEHVANYYEALVGTLKAARKKGLITYEGQVLLKGINDDVVITAVK